MNSNDEPSRALPVEAELQPTAPKRVQLSRAKGWKMPADTVKVDRTTKWGNPFKAGGALVHPAVAFRSWLTAQRDPRAWDMARAAERELRGKNLACWCKPGAPCHADVLLEAANPALRPPVEVGAQSLASLIARVEAATEPELALDAAICVALSYAGANSEGATNVRTDSDWEGDLIFEVGADDCCNPVPALTASLDAALALVARALPEWTWSVGNLKSGAQAYLMRGQGAALIAGAGATPALALLAALLKALQAQPDRHNARDGATPQNNEPST